MNKLRSLGLFGDELLHTVNGREFITKTQVRKEIQEALEAAGGRIAVVDLASLLGVDIVHCQAQVDALVKVCSNHLPETYLLTQLFPDPQCFCSSRIIC